MTIPHMAHLSMILQNIFFILIGLAGMGFLIGFHEFGHFLFAKMFNIRTPSFSIGFGPKLINKKIGDTEFSLSVIPLGGYVEIAGAAEIGQGEQKEAHATDEGSFATKPYYQKLCVMIGGILFNFMFAYFAFTLLFFTGIPKTSLIQKPIITSIMESSAAQTYDFHIGDQIISINDTDIEGNVQRLQNILVPLASQPARIIIKRNNKIIEKEIIIGSRENNGKFIGILGVEFDTSETARQPIGAALKSGIALTNTWIKNTILGFTQLKSIRGEIAGPVMIIAMTTKAASAGFKILLLLLAIISINLAVINLFPLPILDGGQILFYTIEAIIGKPLPDKIREYIHIATWLMFIILFLYLTAKDIYLLATPYLTPLLSYFGQ